MTDWREIVKQPLDVNTEWEEVPLPSPPWVEIETKEDKKWQRTTSSTTS